MNLELFYPLLRQQILEFVQDFNLPEPEYEPFQIEGGVELLYESKRQTLIIQILNSGMVVWTITEQGFGRNVLLGSGYDTPANLDNHSFRERISNFTKR